MIKTHKYNEIIACVFDAQIIRIIDKIFWSEKNREVGNIPY